MASSRRRSRRPGARAWLGLLLAVAAWTRPETAAGAGPGAAAEPEATAAAPAAARRHRPSGAALVMPLPPARPSPPADPGRVPGPTPLEDGAPLPAPWPAAGPPLDPPSQAAAVAGATAADPVAVDVGGAPVPSASAPAAKSALATVRRTLRRDPAEPPLTGADPAWRELLLSVTLNGRSASQGALFAEDPRTGVLAVELASLEQWRVEVDEARVVTFAGEPYYPLAAIPGAAWSLDRQHLAIALQVPPERFATSRVAGGGRDAVATGPAAGRGGFVDYDLVAATGEGLGERGVDGLVEAGAFGAPGTLTSGLLLDDVASGAPGATRLDTTLSRDFPSARATLRIGDGLTAGGAFAGPARFGGVQYATNFGTDPAFVPFPLPTIGGLAEQESVVDVLIDNLARARGEVPAGPFSIDGLPVVTGAGEVQLRVTDLLGRERVVTQPYYVSSRLLKAGLRDFSYELGAEREGYGRRGFDYGEPLAVATERHGLTDRLTAEAHLELEPGLQSAAAGGYYLLGRLGVASAALGASLNGGDPGGMGELGYEYDGRRLNLGLRTRLQSSDFAQVGGFLRGAARTDQASLGLDLGADAGRLGFLLLNRASHDRDDVTTLAATYGRTLGPGSLSLQAAQLFRPDTDLALTAAYVLPLGLTRNLATQVELGGGDGARARTQFRQSRGASDLGLDYRLGAEAGGGRTGADLRATYQAAVGTAEIEAERVGGEDRLRAGISGSVALVDGHVAVSRRLGRAFGLVALPGYPDVRVYLDNREAGRTDAGGRLLLPELRPYEANKVRLEVEDLPLDAPLASAEAVAVPFDRAGVSVPFALGRRGSLATATLADGSGRALPSRLRLASADGAVTALVARDGFAEVRGELAAPGAIVEGEAGGRRYACALPPPPRPDELLPDLGVIACR